MRASLTLDSRYLEREMLAALADELTGRFLRRGGTILGLLRENISGRIKATPEWQSLTSNGQLAAELGVPNALERMNTLLDYWLQSTQLTLTKPAKIKGRRIEMRISLVAVEAGRLDRPEGVVQLKQGTFPWLKFLLFEGDKVILEFGFTVGNDFERSHFSRTGLGLMKGGQGKHWRVPAWAAGTRNDNFLTRALNGIEDDIADMFERQLT